MSWEPVGAPVAQINDRRLRNLFQIYGIMTEMAPYFYSKEFLKLQCINRWFYNTAVGRVQTRIKMLGPNYYFTYEARSRLNYQVVCMNVNGSY